MAGKGGFRPGAGRKPKRLHPITLSPIRLAEVRLSEKLPELVEVALMMALGTEDVPPDKAMLIYCIDRVLGRTIQPISVETQVDEIAADFGVGPERVTSIVERLKAKRTG